VESISRLGRNVDDLRLIVHEFKNEDITVHFIKEGFNTGNHNNMFKFMITYFEAVAEMECELTIERIREGISKTKRYGTRSCRPIGRPPRKIPATEYAKLVGISRPTLYHYIRDSETAQ